MNPCVRLWMLCVVVACVTAPATAQGAKLNSLLDVPEFVRDWQISKQFTMEVVQAMPSEYYSFKATPEEMTFLESRDLRTKRLP